MEKINLLELDIETQRNVSGGNPLAGWVIGAIFAFAYESASNPQATSAAFMRGYESTQTRISLNF